MESKKALIIVDMLNDFMKKEGTLYCGDSADKIVNKIKTRLDTFRSNNDAIIFLQDSHDENDKEFKKFPKHCVKETWGSKIIDEISPLEYEVVIQKTRFSGFYNTNLSDILKEIDPKEVFVTGVCSSICVMDTVGGLSDRDYNVTIPLEEIADFDNEMHELSVKRMKNLYGAKFI